MPDRLSASILTRLTTRVLMDLFYNDKFNFTVEDLVEKLSIDEEQAQRILDLTNRGSASHSAWLMFMYPRLQLSRDLLAKDGV